MYTNYLDVGECKKQQLSAGRFGMLGAYTPQCKDDGSFKEKQCHGSTGYCWCVEAQTGKEIPNTRKGEGRGEGTVSCGMFVRYLFI